MKSQICDILKIEFPLIAFSHCRDVVAAVTNAGGMGVLGAVGLSPEKLEIELSWIDEHVNGKPYGVDVLVPNSYVGKGENLTSDDLISMIPQEHRDFRADVLEQHDLDASDLRGDEASKRLEQDSNQVLGAGLDGAKEVSPGIDVIAVATSIDRGRDNYPPQEWLEREGWSETQIYDLDREIGEAYGLNAFPYWVFLDKDLNVLARRTGNLPEDMVGALLIQLANQ